MSDKLLSTGQAASMCSVSPDTVLKWIRSGSLPARRTAGGHHRIAEQDLRRVMDFSEEPTEDRSSAENRPYRYCWEFYGNGGLKDGCRDCAVYQMRAQRCYEVIKLAPEALHSKVFCQGSCEECDYYKHVQQQRTNVLVVSDDSKLTRSLASKLVGAEFNLEVTDCEYATSALVDRFRPDYAIVDCSLGKDKTRDIAHHLALDPRLPFVRVVLAGGDGEFPTECDQVVFARITRPFDVAEIRDCIGGITCAEPDGA